MGGLRLLILVCCVLVAGAPAHAQDQREKALQLMELTGAHQLAMQAMSTVLPQLMQLVHTANPNLDERLLRRLAGEMQAEAQTSQDELLAMWAEIYLRHFSAADLDGLIAFYRAPLGQKVLAEMPAVMQEGATAGGSWGQSLAARALERIKARPD